MVVCGNYLINDVDCFLFALFVVVVLIVFLYLYLCFNIMSVKEIK